MLGVVSKVYKNSDLSFIKVVVIFCFQESLKNCNTFKY